MNPADKMTQQTDSADIAFERAALTASAITHRASHEQLVQRLRELWAARQFISRCVLAGLILSASIAFLMPRQFTSTVRLMPPDQANSSMAMLAAAASSKGGSGVGAFAGDLLGLKSSGALFVGILQSRTILDGLVQKFDLRKVYWDSRWEDARADLAEHTHIAENNKSGIITIQVNDNSPKRAAALAQEYVEQLNRVVAQLNTTSAHRERMFLEERLVEIKSSLELAEKEFSEFASKNAAMDIEAQGKAMIGAAAALEGEWIGAQTELEGLKQVYTDSNVRVRATQARAGELRRQLEKLGGKPDTAAAAGGPTHALYPSIRQLPLLGVSYADLYRNAKVQEAVYEALTQQFELAKVQEAKETPSVKVIDPADIPENKSSPKRLLIIALGTGVSLGLGTAFVLAAAAWGHIDPRDPGKVFASEILAITRSHLPFLSGKRTGAQTSFVTHKTYAQENTLEAGKTNS
jgi:uncharacterized protein involved in exopolysaccharide biosynthesis